MKAPAIAVLLGLAIGFLVGLGWRSHQATEAEAKAHVADSLYQASQAREVLAVSQRDAFDHQRVTEQRRADSLQAVADDSLTAIQQRAAQTSARGLAALAAASSIRDTATVYRTLYEEASSQRDDALRAAEDQRKVAGALRAMLVAGDAELARERLRGDGWKSTADQLAAANRELLAHRRPAFNLKLGLGGFLSGAATATVVCVATGKCG